MATKNSRRKRHRILALAAAAAVAVLVAVLVAGVVVFMRQPDTPPIATPPAMAQTTSHATHRPMSPAPAPAAITSPR